MAPAGRQGSGQQLKQLDLPAWTVRQAPGLTDGAVHFPRVPSVDLQILVWLLDIRDLDMPVLRGDIACPPSQMIYPAKCGGMTEPCDGGTAVATL